MARDKNLRPCLPLKPKQKASWQKSSPCRGSIFNDNNVRTYYYLYHSHLLIFVNNKIMCYYNAHANINRNKAK